MGRKFTVYGLRFSKTSFWNRMNTGFLDPAVATVLTACGIETLLHTLIAFRFTSSVATVLTACGIETYLYFWRYINYLLMVLQQCLPLAVLKLSLSKKHKGSNTGCNSAYRLRYWNLMEYVQYSVTILGCNSAYRLRYWNGTLFTEGGHIMSKVATVLTACGIETRKMLLACSSTLKSCNSAYRLRYWNEVGLQ